MRKNIEKEKQLKKAHAQNVRAGRLREKAHHEAPPVVRRCIMAQAARLRGLVPHLTPLESTKLAQDAVIAELADDTFDERWADRPLASTISTARRMMRAIEIRDHRSAIEAAYEYSCAAMGEVGLDFEMLIAWHRGER